jgi:hypothetical protein
MRKVRPYEASFLALVENEGGWIQLKNALHCLIDSKG